MDEKVQTLSSEIDIRKEKVRKLKEQGVIPYIEKFDRTCTLKDAKTMEDGEKVSVCGRITFRRIMGKLSFFAIEDINARLQISISRNEIDEETYAFFKTMVDTGDFVGVSGELYTTHTGEKTVRTHQFQLLSKAILPLPEKFHGLANQDQRYRERCMDLVSNEESRKVFLTRSKFLSFLRRFLEENGFLEVETPIMQNAVCGAAARPFYTHHNALDIDFNLRIAPETYLKQCVAGGFNRVYEIARCFRNEGMDTQHLQEFTQVEWYASYWNFEDNIKFYTNFIRSLFMELIGTTKITYKEHILDFGKENWNRINYCEEMEKIFGFDFLNIEEPEELKKKIVENNLFTMADLEDYKSLSQIIDFVYKRKIRENIIEPTIIYNYPAVLIPLARRNDEDNKRIDVFQVVAAGTELCKAYSELVNPMEQRASFEMQLKAKEQGDDETMDLDENFLSAMEQGMPPISGLGFGIDRLMMLIYNQQSVRDVVLFPMMKPNK